eukprot:3613830-Pyramimonas_sp.AAC.1
MVVLHVRVRSISAPVRRLDAVLRGRAPSQPESPVPESHAPPTEDERVLAAHVVSFLTGMARGARIGTGWGRGNLRQANAKKGQ